MISIASFQGLQSPGWPSTNDFFHDPAVDGRIDLLSEKAKNGRMLILGGYGIPDLVILPDTGAGDQERRPEAFFRWGDRLLVSRHERDRENLLALRHLLIPSVTACVRDDQVPHSIFRQIEK